MQPLTPAYEGAYRRLHKQCMGCAPKPDDDGPQLHEAAFIATNGVELLGLVYGYMVLRNDLVDEVFYGTNLPLPAEYAAADRAGTIALLETIAVAPQARRMGLGEKLSFYMRHYFEDLGATHLISQAWKTTEGKVPAGRIMQNIGLSALGEVKNIWHKDIAKGHLVCPYCKGTKCGCGAVIYGQQLEHVEVLAPAKASKTPAQA